MNAKLFFNPVKISVLLIMLSAITYAETEVFVATDDLGYAPHTNHFKLRDGTDATIGVKVQRLVSGPSANNKYAAPTTNIVLDTSNTNANINIYGNALPADCQDYEACKTWMGDDDAATAASDAGNAGFVSGLIGSSDTSRHGWLRAFSSTRITNSAYYGDAKKTDTALATGGQYNYEWNPSNPAISNVNPAYTIPIDSTPTNGPTYGSVIGSVFATTSGGNNQLESGYILVEWRYENSSSWTTGDSSLDANGDFNFTVTVPQNTNVYVRARVKNVNTPRDGFPFSSEFLVTVTATPATPIVTITAPNGGSDYTVNIGPHSTNIVGTVDSIPDSLVWSNSLNNSGGILTPATSFDFSAALILGVNPITIYATKSGIIGSDAISITVNNPPAPTVNITTGNILTNAWPVYVSGTSSGADSVLLSNIVTGTTYPCTGTDNWSVNITGIDNTAENYVAVAVNIGGSTVSSAILIDHDDIPPTVGQTAPVNNYTSTSANVTFTFTAVDDRHSVATTEINFDGSGWKNFISGSSEAFTEGIHTWEVRATDDVGSGNTSAPSGTRTFYVYEPPTVAFVNPVSSGTYNTNGAVNMTVPVDGTVTAGSTVILSNTTTATEYSANVAGGTWDVAAVALARGNNILIVRAKRNDVDSAPVQITINNQEPGAPVVTITAPNGGSNYTVNIGPHSTNIVGTVDSIPDSLVWSNSLNNSGGTLTPTTSFDVSVALVLGTNSVTIYATESGIIGSDNISIIVTTNVPGQLAVTITNPNNGEHYISLLGMHTTNIVGIVTGNPDSVVWSNSLTGVSGSLGNVSSFDFPILLTNGQNNITVSATKNGDTVSDFIIIGVAEPGELLLIITEPNLGNDYSISNESTTNISGLISYAPDSLNWTNSLTGDNGSLILSNRFNFPANLESGINIITVSAVKGAQQYSDSITITVNDHGNPNPYIQVTSPTNWTSYPAARSINITGIATDDIAIVTITRNGTDITSQYTPPNWTDARFIGLGTNTFTYIAIDGDGNSATDIVNYIVNDFSKVSPYIEVISPSDLTIYPVLTNISVNGIATDNVAVVSITRNGIDITSGYTPPNWTDDISADSLSTGTNFFSYIAFDGNGNSATATVRYIVLSNNVPPTIYAHVLETWPRYIGNAQTGTIEFISSINSTWNLFVLNTPSSNTPIATGTCTAGWNLVDFFSGNLPITDDDSSNILQLVIGKNDNTISLSADVVTVVDDLNTQGGPSSDFDSDFIYVKYKSKVGGKCEAKGRTLFITDGSQFDKLIIKVKPAKGKGNGIATICGIISDSGMKSIKIMGNLDRLQLDGILGSLMLKGGSLGRPNATIRYNARFNALTIGSKTKIITKAGKNKTTKNILTANVYANILAGKLESEPNNVKELAGLKMLKIIGGNLGVEYDEISKTTYRHWLNAKYIDIIMVKPKSKIYGGKTFDYSFYFTGENKIGKGSFKKMYFYYGTEDSSDNKQDNISIVCGYDNNNLNPVEITGTNWIGQNVSFGFDKIMTKAGELQGTVVLKNWIKGKTRQVKGTDDARWIVNGKEE